MAKVRVETSSAPENPSNYRRLGGNRKESMVYSKKTTVIIIIYRQSRIGTMQLFSALGYVPSRTARKGRAQTVIIGGYLEGYRVTSVTY
jgi:hypothetical protein